MSQTEQTGEMADATKSPVEALPPALSCHGKFLTLLPAAPLLEGEALQLPRRAASVPAGRGGLSGSAAAMELFSDGLSESLRLFWPLVVARSRRGTAHDGGGPSDHSLAGEGSRSTAPSARGDAWDGQTSTRSAMTGQMTNKSAPTAMTSSPDRDDALGGKLTKRVSNKSVTSVMSAMTMCPDDDDNDALGDDLTKRMSMESAMSAMTTCSDEGKTRGMSMDSMMSATTRCSDEGMTQSAMSAMTRWSEDDGACGDDAHVTRSKLAPDTKGNTGTSASPSGSHDRTLILRDIPCRVNHEELVRVLEQQGFGGRYDFVHVPASHHPKTNVGYAFVNLVDEADEDAFKLAFDGYRFPNTRSEKVCSVQLARLQGSAAQMSQRRKARSTRPALKLSEDSLRSTP